MKQKTKKEKEMDEQNKKDIQQAELKYGQMLERFKKTKHISVKNKKNMEKKYSSLKELIKKNLNNKEEPETLKLINELKSIKTRGYFTKEEFLKICMWKSPRPKQRYLKNSEEKIISVSKKVLTTKFEKRRIELLTTLEGVSIPTVSAILTLIDPQNYGVIDIRVWQILYQYGSVKVKPTGTNFNFKNWYNYLMKLRYYAQKFKVSARDIERTIFYHHKKIQVGNLYKY